ncbi:MAG: DEAD/DEAH box helicase family protein [Candidatus Krumholzibacteriia bacterium]
MSRREELRDRIAKTEAQLFDIEKRAEFTRDRLQALREELSSLTSELDGGQRTRVAAAGAVANGVAPRTSAEKIALFRELFRGRADVFARRWANPRTGKKGYAPACSNEWVRGMCEKPRIKCGECPNQAFLPISDSVIRDHLLGRHVVGVYPLLDDDTCWFLAADFDKGSWREDVSAFVDTSRTFDLAPAVERSRSGKGGHVWLFFSAPMAARAARALGCFLITETMERRHQLGMRSYDRLFPNQDTMPRGGFGNLIALPLQHEPRRKGNTIFVDDQLVPHEDQWSYLASVPRVAPGTVQSIAEEARRRGRVIGVRSSDAGAQEDETTWLDPPVARPTDQQVAGSVPGTVRIIQAQKLLVDKSGLPSPLLNQIKRLSAFQNPEFYKRQSMRLSTAMTPRVIACAEETVQYVALPRGCRADLERLLKDFDIAVLAEDQRCEGEQLDVCFHGQLTAAQAQAARALCEHDTGVFVAPPGVGKTVVGTYVIAERRRSTLVLVHRRPLLDQWRAQLSLFLGVDPQAIGQIGAGERRANGRLDVAMLQSLVRKGRVDDGVAGYGQVIVDECHHIPAVSFERVLEHVRARYVLGLTGTPRRRDGQHPIIHMQCGPTRFAVDPRYHATARPFSHHLVVRETGFRADGVDDDTSIQNLYRRIAANEQRNCMILDDVINALVEGRSPILLTERRDHLEYLAARLRNFTRHLVVLHGGMKPKERREATARLAAIPGSEERLVLSTGRYIGEGFDDARLDTLFLAMPVAWKGTLVQYAGRLHRLHPGKTEVRIYDYADREVPLLARMFEKRLRGYSAIGYSRHDPPRREDEECRTLVQVDPEDSP